MTWILVFLLSPPTAHAVPNAEACARFTTSVERLKQPRPKALLNFLGSTTDEFPCPSEGWESAGADFNVMSAKAGQRKVVLLLKRLPGKGKEVAVDVLLLPALAPREVFLGPSRCTHKTPKAPAIAVGQAVKKKLVYKVSAAWVVDREEEKIHKVKTSAVRCEDDPSVEID